MNNLLLLGAASFFVLAPMTQHQVYGAEVSTTVVQSNVKNDENLVRAVKDAISSDKELVQLISTINVSAKDGVVTLSGTVDSAKVKATIEAKAKAVLGVHKVVNNIEVKS